MTGLIQAIHVLPRTTPVTPGLKIPNGLSGSQVRISTHETSLERTVMLPLHYAGLSVSAWIREQEGPPREYALDAHARAFVPVTIPALSRTWLIVEAGPRQR
jgi:hypothetical protein